jgi:hypothetical protein
VLISLRATTVRQAQLMLTTALFVAAILGPLLIVLLAVAGAFVLAFVFSLTPLDLPDDPSAVADLAQQVGVLGAVLLAAAVLLALDAVLLGIAEARFKRTRLVID